VAASIHDEETVVRIVIRKPVRRVESCLRACRPVGVEVQLPKHRIRYAVEERIIRIHSVHEHAVIPRVREEQPVVGGIEGDACVHPVESKLVRGVLCCALRVDWLWITDRPLILSQDIHSCFAVHNRCDIEHKHPVIRRICHKELP